MSAGELEHEWAGTPGRLIRERYRKAAEVSRVLCTSLRAAAVLSIFTFPCWPATLLGSCTCKPAVVDIIPLGLGVAVSLALTYSYLPRIVPS